MKKPKARLEADKRLAAVLNSIGDVYYVLDREWRMVMFNEATEAFIGLPRDKLRGRTIWDVHAYNPDSPFTPLLERAMHERQPSRLVSRSWLRPDRIVDFRVTPLGDEGIGVALIDVTDRHEAEEAIRESRERLDLAVSAHNIGIYDWHVPSGRIVWSPELEQMFGLSPGAFEGTVEGFQSRVLPEDLPRAIAETNAALADGADRIVYAFRVLRADGAVRWLEGVSRVVYGSDGAPERIVGTNFDVTERIEAERAMQASRERLDLAVGAHAVGIFDWDLASGATTWSPELEDIYGLARGAFEGHHDDFRGRVVPEDLERIEGEMTAAQAAGRSVTNYEFRIFRADGAIRWLEGAARFIYDADGKARRVVGTNVDVTERKTAELHQRLLVHELNHRVKNTLAIVQAIAWQSFRAGGMGRQARETLEGRIAALAAAHDVLTQQNWEAGSIAQMVARALAPHDPGDGRLSVSGPDVNLEPKTAVALALAMHELATNAVKYGALSTNRGRVDLRWSTENERLRLTWRETGGPPIGQPIQRGFGTRLLEQGLAQELNGQVRLEFLPEGARCELDAPL